MYEYRGIFCGTADTGTPGTLLGSLDCDTFITLNVQRGGEPNSSEPIEHIFEQPMWGVHSSSTES